MLRVRTGFSFRRAVGHIDEVISRLVEIGATYAPITDTSTFGYLKWSNAAQKAGLTPRFGVEIGVTTDKDAKKPAGDDWTFLAKDRIRGVNNLVGLATSQFRYQPWLTLEQAARAEGVFKIAGRRAPINDLDPDTPDLFIALAPSTPLGLAKIAQARGFRFVATSDNVYPRPEDAAFYQTLCGFGASTQSYPQHLLSASEWAASVAHLGLAPAVLGAAQDRAVELLEASTFALGAHAQLPEVHRPATLREMCEAGAARLGVDLSDPVYAARLTRELDLIKAKEFEEYFYIVSDLVSWARGVMSVGPARGSSCGSLACYLLGITMIDPIPFGLIFERFIDINRNDMPDIDIDFSDQQRPRAIEYLREKYGSDHFARVGTVNFYQARSALQETGAALNVPRWMCEAVIDNLIVRSSGDSRVNQALEDTLATMPPGQKLLQEYPEIKVATRFEGHPRHSSQHAAGVVIARQPVEDFVAVDNRTNAMMCDWRDAEAGYGLLKIDVLGLTQLSVFEDALELAGLPHDHLDTIPLEDKLAFDVLNRKQFSGIFQFNGRALQSIVVELAGMIDRFEDFSAITALARPGPLVSGATASWINRRAGLSPVSYQHPLLEPYLQETLGVPIYQEQIMEICRNVGSLSWEDVSKLRKAMSKGYGQEYFDQYGNPFKAAAIEKGMPPELAQKVWDALCTFGAMGFNKAHAVAYGLISYWCCWLKARYPVEFAAATLSHEPTPEKQIKLLRELAAEGVGYVPVDPDISHPTKWQVREQKDGSKIVVGPLLSVKNIGPKMAQSIVSARSRGEKPSERAVKLLTDPKTSIDSLYPVRDAFARLLPDPRERNILTPPTPIGDLDPKEDGVNAVVFCVLSKINPRDENEVVLVARRGHRIQGNDTFSLNLQLEDDTGSIFGKISRRDFARLGKPIIDRGRVGKLLYVMKGRVQVLNSFTKFNISAVRYIGDMDPSAPENRGDDQEQEEQNG